MNRSAHINFYSAFLFPIYKYNSTTNRMVRSNKSATYLYSTFALIMLWGFIASIALPIDWRYIGLSLSALVFAIGIFYFEYLTFSTTTVKKECLLKYFTEQDLFDCYKLSASISTDHKDLYIRGKPKPEIDIAKEFKEISVRKSIEFERQLARSGICSRAACGRCSREAVRKQNTMRENLQKLQIEKNPELEELKDIDDDAFNDIVYVNRMIEFSAFAHTLNNKIIKKAQMKSAQIKKIDNAAEENIPEENSLGKHEGHEKISAFKPVSTIINPQQNLLEIKLEIQDPLKSQQTQNLQNAIKNDKESDKNNVTNIIARCYEKTEGIVLENESQWGDLDLSSPNILYTDVEFNKEDLRNDEIKWLRAKDTNPANYKVSIFLNQITHEDVTYFYKNY